MNLNILRYARAASVLTTAFLCNAPAVAQVANNETPPALAALPSLTVSRYLGTWYQVALFPNRFQRHCVSDTTATYQQTPDGGLSVANRCRQTNGQWDQALGQAEPVGSLEADQLKPAQLRVSFLPAWLRWLPVGWGDYWVIQLASDGRYSVVSEPTRRYLWVLSRTPRLLSTDESAIRAELLKQGFDLSAWRVHEHTGEP